MFYWHYANRVIAIAYSSYSEMAKYIRNFIFKELLQWTYLLTMDKRMKHFKCLAFSTFS